MNIIMHICSLSFLRRAAGLVAQIKKGLEAVHEHREDDAIEGPEIYNQGVLVYILHIY